MKEFRYGEPLTVDTLHGISAGTIRPQLTPEALQRARESHQLSQDIARQRPIYGRSTGVGANRLTSATGDIAQHGLNLIRSHAADGGERLDDRVTRAALVVRLNQLLQGGSGIDPAVLEALHAMIASDALPELRSNGSIGTGDLPALSGIALALIGERQTAIPVMPLGEFTAESALPFISSSAVTIADVALLLEDLTALITAGHAVFAISAVAMSANPEAFAPAVGVAIGTAESRALSRQLTDLVAGAIDEPRRIQDPYAFRGYLQTASVVISATSRLREHVESLMNVAQENPLFDLATMSAYHHGAFYQVALAHELDGAAIAVAQHAPLLISRLRFMNDDTFSGLPRFLAPEGAGSSGTMMLEYLAASAFGDIVTSAAPASIHTTTLSCGVEDDATFAPTATKQLRRSVEALRLMLAVELVVASRALRLTGHIPTEYGDKLSEILKVVKDLPEDMADRDLRGDVEVATALLPMLADTLSREASATAHAL